ncbi:MAG: thiol:disulfide interchange protein, partial [Bacteroidales bacterium]|nr:thiol:disulfide interchange protein [Bacteroidales bacterium]
IAILQTDTLNNKQDVSEAGNTPITKDSNSEGSLWALFFTSLLAGFGGLLTPCVYPMIPMTVSFFMRGQENRGRAIFNALFSGSP